MGSVPARLSLVTLGVTDLQRATDFYRALGWTLSSASAEGVSFFHTAGGILALYPMSNLCADAELPSTPLPPGFRGVTLAINLDGLADVDEAYAQALAAGGVAVKSPEETEWGGYVGYFADPDGHVWEVAHNPFWPIGSDGRPSLP